MSVVGMVVLACLPMLIDPPSHLPDLHAVLICTYSFIHFLSFFIVFHWLQWTAVDDTSSRKVTVADCHKLKTH